MKSQTERILNHLVRHGSITPIQALNKFGCFRLSGRINDLRNNGHSIETVMIKKNGKHFAKYVL